MLRLSTFALLAFASSAVALPLQSQHEKLVAVPLPGKSVNVDGQLEDWDLSGAMHVYPARNIRERFAVRVHAMWDKNALYFALVWSDPTPLLNNVDAESAPAQGWMADCFQGRFTTDQQVHLTAWYSSSRRKNTTTLEYGNAASPSKTLVFRDGNMNLRDPSGFQQAFQPHADNRGYTQEIRIPWLMLFKEPKIMAGLKFGFTGEYFWGGPSANTWPGVMWSDPINPKNPVRIVIYQNPQVWGSIELAEKGNLPPVIDEDEDLRLQGTHSIRFEVPKDASKFSLVVENAKGERVRNLAAHANINDYVVTSKDGKRMVEVPWDGRGDGAWNRERLLFLGDVVEPGKYTVRTLIHSGVGVKFAGSFFSPGSPPWETADGTGAWGFDHSPPTAVAVVPTASKSKGRTFLGWPMGECGVGLFALDDKSQKCWSWIRRGVGARHLAANESEVFAILGDGKELAKLDANSGSQLKFTGDQSEIKLPAIASGLAVQGQRVAVSFAKLNKVLLLDGASGKVTAEHAIDAPGSITFMPSGDLIGITNGVKLFSLNKAPLELPSGIVPVAITSDALGRWYVSDAMSNDVKMFDDKGKLVRSFGEVGGHQPGAWNPQRMNHPSALAIEEREGKRFLWANEHSPRRVSVWSEGGKLHREYVGNTRYAGTGGFLSDDIPTLGFVDGLSIEFEHGRSNYRVTDWMGAMPLFGPGSDSFGNGNHFLSDANGKKTVEYYVEAHTLVQVAIRRNDRWQCASAIGRADFKFPNGFPKPPNPNAIFFWNDTNADGRPQADEVKWFDPGKPDVLRHKGWGYRCGKDLTFYHSGFAFRPARFTDDGAPIYDASSVQKLPGDAGAITGDLYKTKFGWVASQSRPNYKEMNNVIHGLHEYVGYDEQGRKRWTYPNYWVAVHGAFTAPMAMPGVIMGSLKITGIVSGTDHDVISIRGNIGQEFLIRDDGLYIGELFTDQRMAPASLPPERDLSKVYGLPINDTTLGGEPFNGWMGRQRDGRIRMTYGYTDVRIAEVVGFDTIRDLPPIELDWTVSHVEAAKSFRPGKSFSDGPKIADVPKGVFTSDPTMIIRAGREEVAKTWLRYDDTHLYAKWEVQDLTPLQNKGQDALTAFKTGDGVQLFVAPINAKDGGTRMVMTIQQGKAFAVVYRPNGPGDRPFTFRSPVREVKFAHVAIEPSVKLTSRLLGVPNAPHNYQFTASIPWNVLGIVPKSGLSLKADMGVLLSDDTGASTAQRVQWADRETNVVNDLPSEAEFSPTRWGEWKLK